MKIPFFFIIIVVLATAAYFYVYSRINPCIPSQTGRIIFAWAYWFLALLSVVSPVLERIGYHPLTSIVSAIGSTWLAVLLYAFLLVLAVDLVRLANHFWHFIPQSFTPARVLAGGASLLFILIVSGLLNATFPRVNRFDVAINKEIPNKKELRIALVSDIHLGFIIGNRHASRMVDKINAEQPDIVIFAGDLVDHNPKPVVEENMGENFRRLQAPLGVYAVTGNHEYIGNADEIVNYLSQFGIRFLRDTLIEAGGIQLAGRDDKQKTFFGNIPRKTLDQILHNVRPDEPLILIDHQPTDCDTAEKMGVDLMLSGHTHYGQLFPFKPLTEMIYNVKSDLSIRGNTHYYISPGYGTWGPPVRLGNRPEIAVITLKFQ